MGIPEVLAFLKTVTDAELRARRAKGSERSDKKYRQIVRDLEAMGDVLSAGFGRPSAPLSAKFKEALRLEAADLHLRSIFAIARYQHGRADLYRAWMGSNRRGPRGESMEENLYVAAEAGVLKVVARYYCCSTCAGNAKLEVGPLAGSRCPDCSATGFQHGQGTAFKKLGKLLEVHKLGSPSDALSRPAYDAIEEVAPSRKPTAKSKSKSKSKPKPKSKSKP